MGLAVAIALDRHITIDATVAGVSKDAGYQRVWDGSGRVCRCDQAYGLLVWDVSSCLLWRIREGIEITATWIEILSGARLVAFLGNKHANDRKRSAMACDRLVRHALLDRAEDVAADAPTAIRVELLLRHGVRGQVWIDTVGQANTGVQDNRRKGIVRTGTRAGAIVGIRSYSFSFVKTKDLITAAARA
ncbi:hypothetical protein [Candidatus Binatus sp.]|uniref:hypothetical protein n=1 Tax=Candidatus Binatus sp. TaxID=2811406 RepID=UPI00272B24F6|nr:hypothetical protein [Candidatus Binatus sp.]